MAASIAGQVKDRTAAQNRPIVDNEYGPIIQVEQNVLTSRNGKGHADFTMRKRENLSGVGERNRTLTRRVEGREEEDEECD